MRNKHEEEQGNRKEKRGSRERSFIAHNAGVDDEAEVVTTELINNWVDEAYEEFVRSGGMDNLPGKGKPLKVPTGHVLETVLRNANVPPPWITLRKEILEAIRAVHNKMKTHPEHPDLAAELEDINDRIDALNVLAPSLTLHKKKITKENLAEQLEKWH